MPLGVTKDCFPDPTDCHNCMSKRSEDVKKQTEQSKDYKRCGKCHMMTYCDKDCQTEHWIKIHKKHCKFLSGKVLAEASKHNAASCIRCIQERETSPTQLKSSNSPKTVCNIEEVAKAIKEGISMLFGFHGEGKKCNCSEEYALDLPFPLGEVSGRYMEIGSTGLDAMLAHALNILTAMAVKGEKEDAHKSALNQLWITVIHGRCSLWCDILVRGSPSVQAFQDLYDQVNSLQAMYGASNPWWKTLKFSVNFIVETNQNLYSNFNDSHSLEDSRFKLVKLIHDYGLSQLQNQALVCEKRMWPNFMLWPGLANGSLAMLLPPGTHCQNCLAELCGEVVVVPPELTSKSRSNLLFCYVGDNGALMACCPAAKNQSCVMKCLSKSAIRKMNSDKDQWKEFLRENELFKIETRDCDFCLKSSLSSHRCSACLAVQYCSTVCQNKDLDFHKNVCATWAKDKSRRILGRAKQKDHWKYALGSEMKEYFTS